jgi:hypothetical protein
VGPRPRQRAGSAGLELGLGSDARRGMTCRTRLLAAGSGEGRRGSVGCAGLTGSQRRAGPKGWPGCGTEGCRTTQGSSGCFTRLRLTGHAKQNRKREGERENF